MKTEKKTNKKDLNFWIECLKKELRKPLNKQDFMYMRYIDEKIYELKNHNVDSEDDACDMLYGVDNNQ